MTSGEDGRAAQTSTAPAALAPAAHRIVISEFAEGQDLGAIKVNGVLSKGGIPSAPLVHPPPDLVQLHVQRRVRTVLSLGGNLDGRRPRLVAVEHLGRHFAAQLGLRCLARHRWVVRNQIVAPRHFSDQKFGPP